MSEVQDDYELSIQVSGMETISGEMVLENPELLDLAKEHLLKKMQRFAAHMTIDDVHIVRVAPWGSHTYTYAPKRLQGEQK